jgi:hypothetical protein
MNRLFEFKDSRYPNQTFKIQHFHPADSLRETVWLECLSNPKIVMTSYVKMSDLKTKDIVQ